MAPMGTHLQDPKGFVTDALIHYLESRAKGGVGLLVVQFASVVPGQPTLGIYSDEHVEGLANLAAAVKRHDCRVIIQLSHLGAYDPINPVASSDINSPLYPCRPHRLSLDDIEQLKEAFFNAARRAHEAGFDGVEIHGGYAYLLASFYSPHLNQRDDLYGDSFYNRMRLPAEIVTAIKHVFPNMVVGFKMNAHEHVPNGIDVDEAKHIASYLEKLGVDYIHIVTSHPYTTYCAYPAVSSCYDLNATRNLASLAGMIKQTIRIPVLLPGAFTEPEDAERTLQNKQADVIMLGRQLIADPDWPVKVKKRIKPIPCIQCNKCHIREVWLGQPVRCTVNPFAGVEYAIPQQPLKTTKKRIIIVGGGPAGMYSALLAAKEGHEVFLFEKRATLGGSLQLAAAPPFKQNLKRLLSYFLNSIHNAEINVFTRTQPTISDITSLKPDVILVATGARPRIPDLDGLDSAQWTTAIEMIEKILNGEAPQKHSFTILGAGRIGCELALFLKQLGNDVTLVDIRPYEEMLIEEHPFNRAVLFTWLLQSGIRLLCHMKCVKVCPDTLVLHDEAQNEREVPFEILVIATGMEKDDALARELAPVVSCPVLLIGDCKEPRDIYAAIHDAFEAINHLENIGNIKTRNKEQE